SSYDAFKLFVQNSFRSIDVEDEIGEIISWECNEWVLNPDQIPEEDAPNDKYSLLATKYPDFQLDRSYSKVELFESEGDSDDDFSDDVTTLVVSKKSEMLLEEARLKDYQKIIFTCSWASCLSGFSFYFILNIGKLHLWRKYYWTRNSGSLR